MRYIKNATSCDYDLLICSFLKILSHRAFIFNLNIIPIPNNLFVELSDENWRLAMKLEMQALEKNKTWNFLSPTSWKESCDCK